MCTLTWAEYLINDAYFFHQFYQKCVLFLQYNWCRYLPTLRWTDESMVSIYLAAMM